MRDLYDKCLIAIFMVHFSQVVCVFFYYYWKHTIFKHQSPCAPRMELVSINSSLLYQVGASGDPWLYLYTPAAILSYIYIFIPVNIWWARLAMALGIKMQSASLHRPQRVTCEFNKLPIKTTKTICQRSDDGWLFNLHNG